MQQKSLIILAGLLAVGVCFPHPQDEPEIAVRAPSTFQNCDCQCDSYTWTSNGKVLGNCVSADATGANFCYVSGRAAQVCRDVQVSATRKDSFSDHGKFYSYEACSTPPRNLCHNSHSPVQNFGDGDLVGAYPGGRPPVAVGPGPFTGTAGRPGGLGAILGVRTAGEGGEAAPADAAGDNADPDKITFADA